MSKADIADIIRKHALANAVQYSGNASEGAILGKVLSETPESKKKVLPHAVSGESGAAAQVGSPGVLAGPRVCLRALTLE